MPPSPPTPFAFPSEPSQHLKRTPRSTRRPKRSVLTFIPPNSSPAPPRPPPHPTTPSLAHAPAPAPARPASLKPAAKSEVRSTPTPSVQHPPLQCNDAGRNPRALDPPDPSPSISSQDAPRPLSESPGAKDSPKQVSHATTKPKPDRGVTVEPRRSPRGKTAPSRPPKPELRGTKRRELSKREGKRRKVVGGEVGSESNVERGEARGESGASEEAPCAEVRERVTGERGEQGGVKGGRKRRQAGGDVAGGVVVPVRVTRQSRRGGVRGEGAALGREGDGGSRKRVRFSDVAGGAGERARRDKALMLSVMQKRRFRGRAMAVWDMTGAMHEVEAAEMDDRDGMGDGLDEKARQVLLDELQYVLDGIFKTVSSGREGGMNITLVTGSLKDLVELLIRKGKRRRGDEEKPPEEGGVILRILRMQPELLKTILNSLFDVLGNSRLVDVLVALVLVVIFRAWSQEVLVSQRNLDALLDGFLRNAGNCWKEEEAGGSRAVVKAERAVRRTRAAGNGKRGIFGRRVDPVENVTTNVIGEVNKLVVKAGILEKDFAGFKNELEGSTYLMGVSLKCLLDGHKVVREWMRKNRRLDRVVAVLYSAERVLVRKQKVRGGDHETNRKLRIKDVEAGQTTSIVMSRAMRVLEFAVLDVVCRELVSTQTNVMRIVIDMVRGVTELEGGILAGEEMLCTGLSLCLNLMRECRHGLDAFLKLGGMQVIVECLATEARYAGLVKGEEGTKMEKTGECFDVRVLCLAVLASVMYEEREAKQRFRNVEASGIGEQEGGAMGLILEMLRQAGAEEKNEGRDKEHRASGKDMNGGSSGQDVAGAAASYKGMERRIMIGYLCLVIGVLVYDCGQNYDFLKELMPRKSFTGVVTVLDEFLEFQHELGVTSTSMDVMYEKIMGGLVEAERARNDGMGEAKAEAEAELKEE